MASSREVQRVLKRFRAEIKRATKDIKEILEVVDELEQALETFNDEEDLDITRGIKGEIRRSKSEVDELRSEIKKLDRELSDTNRKYHYLAT